MVHLPQEELVEAVEHVHFTLFSVMLFFVAQVLVLLRFARETDKEWADMDKACRNEAILAANPSAAATPLFTISEPERQALATMRRASWITRLVPRLLDRDAEQMRDTVVFRSLRHEFLLDRPLDPPFASAEEKRALDHTFDFGRYLAKAQSHMLEHVVEVEQEAWVCFAVGTILFYILANLVHDSLDVLAWLWMGAGWCVFLFNVVFETHLIDLRSRFLPRQISSLLYKSNYTPTTENDANGQIEPDSNVALLSGEGTNALPAWCDVDPDRYVLNERSWITQKLVGGKPNRQQTLFWMDRHGPHFYFLALQINLIFTGVYVGLLVLAFIPDIAAHYSTTVLVIYCIISTIPVIGIAYNKKRLVATLAQVTSVGCYKKVQIVRDVLRQQKTLNVVRTFIIIYNMRRLQNDGSTGAPADASERSTLNHSEHAEISKTFGTFDVDGSGTITEEELEGLLARIGIASSPESVRRIMLELDESGDGSVTRDEFMNWYARAVGRKIPIKELAHEMFHSLDDNNNGEVTIGEFWQKFDVLFGVDLTLDEIGAMVNELDHNNNGTVCFDEFEEFLARYLPDEMRD